MCQMRNFEDFSSSETVDNLYEDDIELLEWPLEQVDNIGLIIACNVCYYPISLEEFVSEKIRDENNITSAIMLPIHKLINRSSIYNENLIEQWKTVIFCPNCAVMQSFLNPELNNISETNFEKIIAVQTDDQIVILQTCLLYRGSGAEAFSRYQQINY